MLNDGFQEKRRYAARKASCITAEQTELLVLDQKTCNILYQPEKKKKRASMTLNNTQASDSTSKDQD